MADATLLHRYSADGLTGTTIKDSVGSIDAENYGLISAPGFATGGAGLEADVAGTGGPYCYGAIPSAAWPGGTFALASWLRLDDPQQSGAKPWLFMEGGDSGQGYYTFMLDGLQVYWTTDLSTLVVRSNNSTYQASVPLPLGQDVKLLVQRAADGALDVYLDDMTTPVLTASGTVYAGGAAALVFAKSPGYTGNVDGVFGDIRIFDGPLSAAQRDALWVPPPAVTPVVKSATAWRLTLTGAADGTTDAVLKIASAQARLRSGSPSYLSVVVPYTADAAAQINARPNGELVLEHLAVMSDGSQTATEVARVALENIQPVISSSSGSINLIGHKQTTNAAPASHTVTPAVTSGQTTTRVWTAADYDPAIRPADSLSYAGQTLTANLISLQISPRGVQVQYSEG